MKIFLLFYMCHFAMGLTHCYKTTVFFTFIKIKCRQGLAPPYLADEFCPPADTEARCRLRSASASSLIVRRTRLSTVGDRAFPVAAPRIWNSLPQHVTSAPSLAVFRSRLKTHLFRRCFPWLRRSLVVPKKWHVITDTLIVFVTYLLTIPNNAQNNSVL